MSFPQVGDILPNGYKVLDNGNNKFILAVAGYSVPEPYVVWQLDHDGDPFNGIYFAHLQRARAKFEQLKYWESEQRRKPV